MLPTFSTPEAVARSTPSLDIKYLRDWIGELPVTNSAAAAQELYRVLFNLNRIPIAAEDRLALMELCAPPVVSVTAGLQLHLSRASLPLPNKIRQLTDFLRQLHMEMAYGYKIVLRDMHDADKAPWSRSQAKLALSIDRALYHLGQILLHSYLVYVPYPAGIWRELHGLYRYAEENSAHNNALPLAADSGDEKTTITRTYLQTVLLGLSGPYQLPKNECSNVYAFLATRTDKATITRRTEISETAGHFLIDLSADLPPFFYPRDVKPKTAPHLRDLGTLELARAVHLLIGRLQKGESPTTLALGSECIDTACIDMLTRMLRYWGLSKRRIFSRRPKKDIQISVCIGLKALHFFSDAQRPFTQPEQAGANIGPVAVSTTDIHALKELDADKEGLEHSGENFRIERWIVRDESAAGLSLLHMGSDEISIRIGDLLGIMNDATGQWRVGVVRWIKNPEKMLLEMGIEMLAPSARPVAVKPASDIESEGALYSPGLVLPAVEALRQPQSLVLSRGLYHNGQGLWLVGGQSAPKMIKPLSVLERSASFEQVIFGAVEAD